MPAISVAPDQVFPILQQSILVDGFHVVVDLQRSRGNVMVDALTGRQYLDCYSYFATLPLGHNHPALEDAAFRASLLAAALANPANSDVYAPEYAAFVQTFRRVAMPAPFVHVFFVSGGTLAVENAMKAAFDWKAQKNRARGVPGGADKVLHLREAFHGRSGYCLSVTNTDEIKTRDFPRFAWPRVENPKLRFPRDAAAAPAALAGTLAAEERSLAAARAAFDADPHGIAAVLVEPVQGEGGDNHFRPEYLQALRRLCDERDALLVFDEVQTGVGLTGSMWAWQQLGVVPDLMAFGKKTQVCGFMSTRRIDEVSDNVFAVSSRINSTWGGSLVDMVRCARYLQVIEEQRLCEQAGRVGAAFLAGLRALQAQTGAFDNARGRGLMLAFDLPDTAARNALRTRLWEAGLATLACGPRSIRFRPALVFTEADAARALQILAGALAPATARA
jgi:L-lysine 6-transaminase